MGLAVERISESIDIKQKILNDKKFLHQINMAADMIRESLAQGGKVLFCGNGGSASDALHMAGEFVGRFQKERGAMAAIALNADVSVMTAIANDYGYDYIFARAIEGLMKPGDILFGFSTSGNSENVYQGILQAAKCGGKTIALLGKDGGKIKNVADMSLIIPSDSTARIQESHIMIGHIISEIVEDNISYEN